MPESQKSVQQDQDENDVLSTMDELATFLFARQVEPTIGVVAMMRVCGQMVGMTVDEPHRDRMRELLLAHYDAYVRVGASIEIIEITEPMEDDSDEAVRPS